jgi:hypothetical protein
MHAHFHHQSAALGFLMLSVMLDSCWGFFVVCKVDTFLNFIPVPDFKDFLFLGFAQPL